MASSGKRAFWMHQAAEYVLGIAFVSQGLQSTTPMIPTLMGGLVVLNTACAKGPLSAFQIFGRRMHRTLDGVVIIAVVIAALQPLVSIDNATRGIMLFLAFALAFIWLQSDFTEKAVKAEQVKAAKAAQAAAKSSAAKSSAANTVANTVANKTKPAAPTATAPTTSSSQGAVSDDSLAASAGRAAARLYGGGVNAYRKRKG